MMLRRNFAVVCAVFLLGCALSTGQAAPATDAKTDPKARALMDQMLAAYRALNSYSAKSSMEYPGEEGPVTENATIAFQQPAKFAVVATSKGGKSTTISDGSHLYVVSSNSPQKNTYVKEPMPSAEYGRVALMQYQSLGFLLTPLLAGVDPLQPPWGEAPKSLSLGKPELIDGVPVEVVIAEMGGNQQLSYAIGKEDHLLRRAVLTVKSNGQTYSITNIHSDIKINPSLPAATFVFTPPPGYKAAENATPLYWDARLKVGAQPFPIKARDLNGKPLSLDQYKGKVVLLDFWASWCGPCVREMPHVQNAYSKYKAQGFDIIGISLDQKRGDLDAFLQKYAMPWRQIFDGKGFETATGRLYGVQAIPFTLLIGRDGKIAAVNVRSLLLDQAIRAALAKDKAVARNEAPDKK